MALMDNRMSSHLVIVIHHLGEFKEDAAFILTHNTWEDMWLWKSYSPSTSQGSQIPCLEQRLDMANQDAMIMMLFG